MKPRLLLPVLLLLGSFLSVGQPTKPVTVILVRHAETAGSTLTERDPQLSDEGRERAEALAHLLSRAGVTHLYSSEYARTRATLGPLAEALGLEVGVIPAREGANQIADLQALPPGSVAAVAGHSNTIPALVAALGGEVTELVEKAGSAPSLDHDAYGRLFVVTLPVESGTATQMIELRYGNG